MPGSENLTGYFFKRACQIFTTSDNNEYIDNS